VVFAVRYLFDAIVLDADRRQLMRSGNEIHVSPKALNLLLFLIQRRPNAVSKGELMSHLWPDTFVSDATLASLVADVREALGDTGRAPRIIRTLHRFGYSFVADIEQDAAGTSRQPAHGWLIGEGWRLSLHEGEVVLGRESDGVITVPSAGVSRRHAAVVINHAGVVVKDLGSKNGTFVDGVRVEDAVALRDGARLKLGTMELTYRSAAGASSTETL
jgi:DNA-binding winged helix-turn-helix (wHTH) protein